MSNRNIKTENNEGNVTVITRYERGGLTTYSIDRGNTYHATVQEAFEHRKNCEHLNTEHHPSGDIHPGSLPYTECLDCGIEIDTEPLEPRDLAE